jgi:hypothetical protein
MESLCANAATQVTSARTEAGIPSGSGAGPAAAAPAIYDEHYFNAKTVGDVAWDCGWNKSSGRCLRLECHKSGPCGESTRLEHSWRDVAGDGQ